MVSRVRSIYAIGRIIPELMYVRLPFVASCYGHTVFRGGGGLKNRWMRGPAATFSPTKGRSSLRGLHNAVLFIAVVGPGPFWKHFLQQLPIFTIGSFTSGLSWIFH